MSERVVATVYTPGIGDGPNENSIGVTLPDEPYVQVSCWGGCVGGVYDPTSGLPDAAWPCVECRGTGLRWVAAL